MMQRLAILLLVCGGLGFFVDREQARGSFDPFERGWLAQVRRAQGVPEPAPPVVLVELRQGDLPFESWPPAPLDYALVFESLVRRQPKEVVVQPLLAWPGVEALDAATLAERIALLPRGVLACTLVRGMDGVAASVSRDLPMPFLPAASGDLSRVPDFDALGQVPIDELRGGKPLGFTRIEFGASMVADGAEVGLPMVARRGRDLVPSLTLQALLSWFGVEPGAAVVQLGRRVAISGGVEVPVDAAGRLTVSARLAPPLRRLDAGALLLDVERDAGLMRERPSELATLKSMQGALVVLGETGESTPRFAMPGAPDGGWTEAEVVARALVASLGGYHLREIPLRWQWGIGAAVVAAAACLLACPRRWVVVFGLGGALVLALACALAFLNGQWWVPPVPPIALWGAGVVVAFVLAPARAGASPEAPAPRDADAAVLADGAGKGVAVGPEPAPASDAPQPDRDGNGEVSNPERSDCPGVAESDPAARAEGEIPSPPSPSTPPQPAMADASGEEGALESLSRELAEDEVVDSSINTGEAAIGSVPQAKDQEDQEAAAPEQRPADGEPPAERPAAGDAGPGTEDSSDAPPPPVKTGKKGKSSRGKSGPPSNGAQARE